MTYRETKAEKAERDDWARSFVTKLLPRDATAYTILKHVSHTGMQRRIDVVAVSPEGRIVNLSGPIARLVGWRFDHDKGGIVVSGCGMDMGFHIVNTLSRVLYEHDDYALKQEWL